ncbi:hypothetical protein ACHAXS_003666 [Conticribra weissflogii]
MISKPINLYHIFYELQNILSHTIHPMILLYQRSIVISLPYFSSIRNTSWFNNN